MKALMESADKGHLDIVDILIEHGADIHDRNDNGHDPLISASIGGHVNVVEFLLSKGANPNDKSNRGHSPTRFMREDGGNGVLSSCYYLRGPISLV